MADVSRGAAPVAPEHAFKRFRDRLIFDFANRFDAWAAQATEPHKSAPIMLSLGDLMKSTPTSLDALIKGRTEAVSRQIDLSWDLARLCRDFITGDLWAWGFYERSQGTPLDLIVQQLSTRAGQTQIETYQRKWRAGVGVMDVYRLDSGYASGWPEPDWLTTAWKVAVEEAIPDFIETVLVPALERPPDAKADALRLRESRAKANRARIQSFLDLVSRETGMRITREDVGLIAGYSGRTEIKRYQSDHPGLAASAEQAILMALKMSGSEAIERLRLRRAIEQRRREDLAVQ